MKYLDEDILKSISATDFASGKPYPWLNPRGIIREDAYRKLADTMPDIQIFERDFDSLRKYGQPSHNRYRLWHSKATGKLPPSWEEFILELQGEEYRSFISRLMNVQRFDLRLEWHYTTGGCSVSPHLDGASTIGAHLFYFNLPEEWDTTWGGETLLLSEKTGPVHPESAPTFEDFTATAAEHMNNHSCIFQNQLNAWHGVRELRCPEGKYRKLFTVFIERPVSPFDKYKARVRSIIRKVFHR